MERDVKRTKLNDGTSKASQTEGVPENATSIIRSLEQQLEEKQNVINQLQKEKQELQRQVKELNKGQNRKTQQSRYWRKDEHERFLEALQKFGKKDVKSIANYVGTRSPTQVRTHAQKWFLKQKREGERKTGGKKNDIKDDSEDSEDSEGSASPPHNSSHTSPPLPISNQAQQNQQQQSSNTSSSQQNTNTSNLPVVPQPPQQPQAPIAYGNMYNNVPNNYPPYYPTGDFLMSEEGQKLFSALKAFEHEPDTQKRYLLIKQQFLPNRTIEELMHMTALLMEELHQQELMFHQQQQQAAMDKKLPPTQHIHLNNNNTIVYHNYIPPPILPTQQMPLKDIKPDPAVQHHQLHPGLMLNQITVGSRTPTAMYYSGSSSPATHLPIGMGSEWEHDMINRTESPAVDSNTINTLTDQMLMKGKHHHHFHPNNTNNSNTSSNNNTSNNQSSNQSNNSQQNQSSSSTTQQQNTQQQSSSTTSGTSNQTLPHLHNDEDDEELAQLPPKQVDPSKIGGVASLMSPSPLPGGLSSFLGQPTAISPMFGSNYIMFSPLQTGTPVNSLYKM